MLRLSSMRSLGAGGLGVRKLCTVCGGSDAPPSLTTQHAFTPHAPSPPLTPHPLPSLCPPSCPPSTAAGEAVARLPLWRDPQRLAGADRWWSQVAQPPDHHQLAQPLTRGLRRLCCHHPRYGGAAAELGPDRRADERDTHAHAAGGGGCRRRQIRRQVPTMECGIRRGVRGG